MVKAEKFRFSLGMLLVVLGEGEELKSVVISVCGGNRAESLHVK